MPLHRDIHWLGRQWAVTGHGLQLINQKQMGYYDIEIARLREPGVIEAMQSKAWIDRPDFDKAVEVARTKFAGVAPAAPQPKPAATPPMPVRVAPPPVSRAAVEPPAGPTLEELLAKLKLKSVPAGRSVDEPCVAMPELEAPKPELSGSGPLKPVPAKSAPPKSEALPPPAEIAVRPADPAPIPQANPVWPVFERKIAGSARFVRPWRVTSARWHGPGLPPRP